MHTYPCSATFKLNCYGFQKTGKNANDILKQLNYINLYFSFIIQITIQTTVFQFFFVYLQSKNELLSAKFVCKHIMTR